MIRFYLVYGPKQDINRFIPTIINGCLKNKKFPTSDGSQLRDFLYIDDAIRGIIMCLENKKSRGQILNIGSGKPKVIKRVIQMVKKVSKGGQPQYGMFKLRKFDIPKLYPNISKVKKKIKWSPKFSFEKGIKITVRDFK